MLKSLTSPAAVVTGDRNVGITVTGADERTSIERLERVATLPGVEVGLLFTLTPEGRNRYPSLAWLRATAARLSGRISVHVCGRGARGMLLEHKIDDLLQHAPRFQVNGQLEVNEVEAICATYPGHRIITQHCDQNIQLLGVTATNHEILMDKSGGRGISPSGGWDPPTTTKRVGYAGGLGPDNLETSLLAIASVAAGPFWVDMEGKLRDESDWFDLRTTMEVIACFHSWHALAKRPEPLD